MLHTLRQYNGRADRLGFERGEKASPCSALGPAKPLSYLFDTTSPVSRTPLQVCDRNDQNQLGLNGVQQALREVVQYFAPYATPEGRRRGMRIFCDERDAPANLGYESEADSGCLVFVIPDRLAELLISFGKKLRIHEMSAIARLNTSSAGMPLTLPSRNS